ncbi:putative transposase [Ancylomarina subtilis]|uniref:Putative transposase n=1 Tax=Ancylomarina subtilis TaxID=1639035 RepID=A0A4Q7VMF0_9BACT|nr:transposase [Ancylomarina subtilis]RZT97496.1 putative transposase [Ancylomarina subtilis]
MDFESGHIYHILNQGNNRRKIFFKRDNYLYFIKKIRTHILPYADIIAWCLMPNHFHLMVHVNNTEITVNPNTGNEKLRSINSSIAIMLHSYTRAINKVENTSGSLFRARTKAYCLDKIESADHVWYSDNGISMINTDHSTRYHLQTCFNYIHNNPSAAKLVECNTDWEFSSAIDYADRRNGNLVNKDIAIKLGLI